ncbi:DNA-J related domain-containing protein [Vibrio zhugei]|uniref:DNA-J related domain-containing protein n=1 Tax=Vibrio zhugei TaxID=2479546 RepID=A0ABV7C557_9VIBR|nr:DNA-J related domain-containing protein [Vibrio zhugei]
MLDTQPILVKSQTEMDNPLVWPIFEVLKQTPSGWKVHTLSAHLGELGFMPKLDDSPEKDLFKRNFLIMNALFQLQETVYPEKWLQVEAMEIEMKPMFRRSIHYINLDDPLRDYYMEWANYEANAGEVRRLLNEFWTRYRRFVGGDEPKEINFSRAQALRLFELNEAATDNEIRKTWRKLAMRWHPDREKGDAERFRVLCEAWNILRKDV